MSRRLSARDLIDLVLDDGSWEKETGLELTAFFDAWIMGRRTPAPGVPAG